MPAAWLGMGAVAVLLATTTCGLSLHRELARHDVRPTRVSQALADAIRAAMARAEAGPPALVVIPRTGPRLGIRADAPDLICWLPHGYAEVASAVRAMSGGRAVASNLLESSAEALVLVGPRRAHAVYPFALRPEPAGAYRHELRTDDRRLAGQTSFHGRCSEAHHTQLTIEGARSSGQVLVLADRP
jgi:hypothetical protein